MIKLKNLTIEQTAELVPTERMILLDYRGSVAHGMYVPSTDPDSIDDKDIMGIYVAPLEHYLGFGRQDVINLLVKQNPNVLSLLWLPENQYIHKDEFGQRLIDARNLFASKTAYHSFTGYAHGQLKRMTHLNQEALEDINSRLEDLLDRDCTIKEETGELALPPGASPELQNAAKQYAGLRSKYFSGYMGNKRKGLVQRFGYDTKNAAHLIRILRMGIEFLSEGKLHVEREDKLELLAIKRGEWSLEKVQMEAERLFTLAREANVRSPLPPDVDQKAAEQLCMSLVADFYGLKT